MEKTSKILKIILVVVLALIVLSISIFGGFYFVNLLPIEKENTEKIEFKVEAGWGKNKIADELAKSKIIKSSFFTKIYLKLNETKLFVPGTFVLNKSMSVEDIILTLTTTEPLENKGISVTFIEGKRFPYYVERIAANFDYTKEEILKKTKDKEYLQSLIDKYWFIKEDILNKDIYYPLEGYIFPDTYSFKKDSSIEEILDTLLKGMESKLKPYKDKIEEDDISVHEVLTMASLVELEAVTKEDRMLLVTIFNNRIKKNITLGSDVTTYYAAKKELTSPLLMSDINACNAYNTRGSCVKGLPVGPIACSSLSSIDAVFNPTDNDYIYFVADKNNKLYFGKTESDHLKNIRELKSAGLWPE